MIRGDIDCDKHRWQREEADCTCIACPLCQRLAVQPMKLVVDKAWRCVICQITWLEQTVVSAEILTPLRARVELHFKFTTSMVETLRLRLKLNGINSEHQRIHCPHHCDSTDVWIDDQGAARKTAIHNILKHDRAVI